ncbi:VanZ family protein [Krasilnikovia sp. M28-CT-15]|uniref:VanZ family protein n=1 Tax=Krasilnikovia sp. M28-CT-15 TaxID=3373540 RepID=UPI0038776B9C
MLAIMLDAAIILNVLSQPDLLAVLGITVFAAWPVGARLARACGRPRALGVWFVLIAGAVLAATATTGASHPAPDAGSDALHAYLGQFVHPSVLAADLRGFAGTDEKLANIGLFLPLGLLGTLLWRRPVAVVCGGALASFGIELWQALIGRGGDAADVLHNTAGALAGTVLGLLLLAGRRRAAGSRAAGRRRGARQSI